MFSPRNINTVSKLNVSGRANAIIFIHILYRFWVTVLLHSLSTHDPNLNIHQDKIQW